MSRNDRALVLVLMAMTVGAAEARADSIVLPRPGQVGICVQGGYGTLLSGSDLGEAFGPGPEFAVRLRYRMRYERGLGLSFENQKFEVRDPQPPDSMFAAKDLTFITSGVEFYQLFATRTRTVKMLMVGAGFAQVSAELNNGETTFPGDGVYVSAGAGIERFFFRSWAYDLSLRYLGVFREGKPNHDLQASLGVIFYASY